jgi:phenylacetate-coenzyme A ligase PaaK-like adenylate-forming protein
MFSNDWGYSPKDLTLDRIAELPSTSTSALRASPEVFINSRAEVALQACTTGTTGTPASCWFSAWERDIAAAYGAVSLLVNGGTPDMGWDLHEFSGGVRRPYLSPIRPVGWRRHSGHRGHRPG